MSPSRRLSPDRALEIELSATVGRDYYDGIQRDEAIELLRQRASGRADLLALAAAQHLGSFLARASINPFAVEFASRLIAAGADLDQVVVAADQVRANVKASGY